MASHERTREARNPLTLRELPSVDELLRRLATAQTDPPPHEVAVRVARRVLDEARAEIKAGREPADVLTSLERQLERLASPSLVRVINATGVVLHTNLGRAPLPAA